jgi:hypothetical protein
MKCAAPAVLVAGLMLSGVARAEERPVMVLEPDDLGTEQWPEGTRAVIAELSANGFRVVEAQSHAPTAGALLAEVAHTASPASVLGVVAVLREGDTGAAYVWTARGERVLRDDTPGARGAVAEGAIALRVVEFFRNEQLEFPLGEPSPPRRVAPAPPPSSPSRGMLWLGAGTALSWNSGTPPLDVHLGATLALVSPFSVDLGGSVGLLPERIESSAGRLSLRAQQFGGRVMFDPGLPSSVGLAVGLGASSLWLQERATGRADFQGKYDTTQVMLLAARARLALRQSRLAAVLVLDSGVTFPAISVRADQREVTRLGRPWTTVTLGGGWAF